jgi:hypothetical protein
LPTKETEKDLLLSLSQVLREIQSWRSEISCDKAVESREETVVDHDESADALYGPDSIEYLCLERLVADLVCLLGMENVHVKHLAGNILVEVSGCLVESVCYICLTRDFRMLYSSSSHTHSFVFPREVNGMSSFVCFVNVCG